MKRIWLVMIVALASGCTTGNPGAPAALVHQTHYPSAAELGRCPFGHTHLKDVPLVYGDLVPDPELTRRLKNLDVWYGGCLVGDDSESFKVVCPDCRYCYEAGECVWFKSADTPAEFAVPLSDLVTHVPSPPGAVNLYQHKVTPDGRVVYERRYYYGTGATSELASRVNAFVQSHCATRLEGHASQSAIDSCLVLRGRRGGDDDGWAIGYRMERVYDRDQVSVDFATSRPEFEQRWYDDGGEAK